VDLSRRTSRGAAGRSPDVEGGEGGEAGERACEGLAALRAEVVVAAVEESQREE